MTKGSKRQGRRKSLAWITAAKASFVSTKLPELYEVSLLRRMEEREEA